MTVLQCIMSSQIGGAETYLLRLITYLHANGHRLILVTRHGTSFHHALRERYTGIAGIEVHAWRTGRTLAPITRWRLRRVLKSQKPDVMQTFSPIASLLFGRASREAGIPLVSRAPSPDSAHFYQCADYLIAVSEDVRDHLIAQGVPAHKVRVIYNGVDVVRHAPDKKIERAKAIARLHLQDIVPADAPILAVTASLKTYKGHRFLLEALAGEPGLQTVHLLVAGCGSGEASLREQVRQQGLEGRIHFLGFQTDVLPVLSACDVFALPSLREGISNAVMEAMAYEVPVVVTRVGGMSEVVRNGETGWLVPPGDPNVLAKALRCAFEDTLLRARVAQAGRQLMETKFDDRQRLPEAEELLMNAAAQSRSNKGG